MSLITPITPWKQILDTQQHSDDIDHEKTWQVPLNEYRLIIVEGLDAETFLQGQCTCDFSQLERNIFVLGAHCTHKGRMNSNFIAARINQNTFALRVNADISQFALDALKKYAVFSKVTLHISEDYQLLGLVGPEANTTASEMFTPGEDGELVSRNGVFALYHAKDQIEIWCPNDNFNQLLDQLNPLDLQSDGNLWRLKNIQRGIGEVEAVTLEKLIPQEINLQYLDGISFKKGCYTGQEIIARLHYRGQQKKHMYRATVDTKIAPQPTTAVYEALTNDISTPNKTRGMIINSARTANSQYELLVLCDDVLTEQQACIMIDNSSVNIQWTPLPYAIS